MPNSMSFSVVIHTFNSEKDIEECISSALHLTSDVLVVDMESTDRTQDIVKKHKISLQSFPFHGYVEPARKFGIQQAKGDFIFILDSDERITAELADEIKACASKSFTYYKVPRKNIFGRKKWLQHGGWSPDYQIRLIKKSAFKDWPERIHSTPLISGECGFLTKPLIHYFHGDIESMVTKTTIFENIESDLLFHAKKSVQTSTFFRKFLGELSRRLIFKHGFLDGHIGIIESIYQAFSKTITYLFLYEKKSRTL